MADAIVSAVLNQLLTIIDREIEHEVRLVVGIEQEVEKMRNTFQTIQAVLVDAENRHLKEDAVKLWLDKLKHISYDIDDVLDEWNTAILKSKIKRDDQAQGSSWPKRRVQSPSTSFDLSSKVRSCIPSPRSCFGGVAQRHDIAVKIKDLNERLQAISKEKDNFSFLVDLTRTNNDDLETGRPKTTHFVDESKIHGRDQDKHTLISMLLSENNSEERGIPIISIVGMGGLGKTTLAQIVYNHHELGAYFHKKMWVSVSNPFDEMRVAKAILETLMGSASSLGELNTVLDKIHDYIEGKRFLLVLDDVWNEDEEKWQSLKNCLNCGSQGSKILVTTRKENVAAIMGCNKLFHLGKLSQEACWSLFSQIAFSGRNDIEHKSLEDIGKKIAYKSRGLPLAAKTLGGLLRFKRYREEWQMILDSHMWELDEVEKGLFSPLLLSYYDLPSPLRQCFSYCAIFPKDHKMEKDLLIKLWMAQGFLGETQGKKMEIVGEQYFDILATHSFFQEFQTDANDDSIVRCKMHETVQDLAQLLRKTECCVTASSEEQRVLDCYHDNVRHLTLVCDNKHIEIPDATYTVKKLRSLQIISNFYNMDASLPKFLDQLTCLRTLNLSNGPPRSSIKELPQEIEKLIHLRYLNLEGSLGLYELPEALCDLCNLQTLNIRSCYNLSKLPQGMNRLISLRHIQNAETSKRYSLFMPKGIRRLTCLQTLEEVVLQEGGSFYETETSSSCSLKDLGKLIHLRGNLKIFGLGNVEEASEAKEARLSTKTGLQSLSLRFDVINAEPKQNTGRTEDEAFVLQALQPPQNLQILEMGFCEGPAFPSWMTSMISLKSVRLFQCHNWESLPSMGKLPSLESLTIWHMKKVKKVGEEFLGVETETSASSSYSSPSSVIAFPSLKQLEFGGMSGWKEWEYDNIFRSRAGGNPSSSSSSNITVMPKLERLSILECPLLKTLPRHLLQTGALKELVIRKNHSIFRRHFNKETGEGMTALGL